jgi:hypothetical protein
MVGRERQSEHTRAREPVSRSKGRVTGYYASWKNKRPVAWESQLERDACALFEFSPAIASFKEQPETFEFEHEGNVVKYTPDFVLFFQCGGVAYVEVKPENQLELPVIKNRLVCASEYLTSLQSDFIVLTEKEIRLPNYATNLAILKLHSRIKLNQIEIDGLQRWLRKQGSAPIFSLSQMLGSTPKAFAFIAQGFACVDLGKLISETTIAYSQKEGNHESIIFSCRFAPDFK